MTQEEIMETVRNYRDRELKETDWTAGTDVPQAIKDIFNPYRQLMRDLPSQEGVTELVFMPERPILGDS